MVGGVRGEVEWTGVNWVPYIDGSSPVSVSTVV